jgi:hypothetical protein
MGEQMSENTTTAKSEQVCVFLIGRTICGHTLARHRRADGSPMDHDFASSPQAVKEQYQRRADFGPYGDATTPGFLLTDKQVEQMSEESTAVQHRAAKPYEDHLQGRLRTDEEIAGYLEAALEAIENYSPKDELAALALAVNDVIKVMRSCASISPVRVDETSTAYNAAAYKAVENDCIGTIEQERLQKAPAWVRSLVNSLVQRIYNLRRSRQPQYGAGL